ncbi:MAG: DUF2185 domain-containing protein [Bacteroidales bacterium]|nr:DUF2185 domain-containing protein [Bacteroidales bacterium]MBN2756456.1 DUF2185 domain-containing protein [Bacteroidales bacterium]
MSEKRFLLSDIEIKDLMPSIGYCYVSDKITVDGMKVGFMYREKPYESDDSGWRFLSGTETDNYLDDTNNLMIFDVNTVANYDSAIIPYMKYKIGSELERIPDSDKFQELID